MATLGRFNLPIAALLAAPQQTTMLTPKFTKMLTDHGDTGSDPIPAVATEFHAVLQYNLALRFPQGPARGAAVGNEW